MRSILNNQNATVKTVVVKKEGMNMRKLFKDMKKKAVMVVAGAVSAIISMTSVCLAAPSTSSIIKPLTNLKTLVIAIIGAVGIIILAKNVMEFAQAYQQQDSSTMNSALKGIVAGIMMAGISAVLTFLGF